MKNKPNILKKVNVISILLMLFTINFYSQTYQISEMKFTKSGKSSNLQKADTNDNIQIKKNSNIIILDIEQFPFRHLKILKIEKIDNIDNEKTNINGYYCETSNDNGILTFYLFHNIETKTFLLNSRDDESFQVTFYYD